MWSVLDVLDVDDDNYLSTNDDQFPKTLRLIIVGEKFQNSIGNILNVNKLRTDKKDRKLIKIVLFPLCIDMNLQHETHLKNHQIFAFLDTNG